MTCIVVSCDPETQHVPTLLDRRGLSIICDHLEHLEIERVGFRQLMSSIVPQSWQRPDRQATHRSTNVGICQQKCIANGHKSFCYVSWHFLHDNQQHYRCWRCMLGSMVYQFYHRHNTFVTLSVQVPGHGCDNC